MKPQAILCQCGFVTRIIDPNAISITVQYVAYTHSRPARLVDASHAVVEVSKVIQITKVINI
jgi:hypothetical protein